jgi:hypothetical protein
MTVQYFNNLSDAEKNVIIFEAEKVDEIKDVYATYTLFKANELYIEVTTSNEGMFRKKITPFDLKDLPMIYTSNVYATLGK